MNTQERDALVYTFRRYMADKLGIALFEHQAEWILASDGYQLTGKPAHPQATTRFVNIRRADTTVERMGITERPGGKAKVLADLAAYKSGKSWSGAFYLAGFAAVPGARVDIIGLQYQICTPEFDYLAEFLLSDRGLGLPYTRYHNQPKSGRMLIEIKSTGARFECRSWEQKEMLKGQERDAYYFCESYMLPGLSAFKSVAQNLRKRRGSAVFTTTADRPWVTVFHERGHGQDPSFADWHCTCGVHARENPYTFSQQEYDRDHPQKGGLMTRDQFAVAWEGKLGEYVGRVYNYQRGQRQFTRQTHPEWWAHPTQDAA